MLRYENGRRPSLRSIRMDVAIAPSDQAAAHSRQYIRRSVWRHTAGVPATRTLPQVEHAPSYLTSHAFCAGGGTTVFVVGEAATLNRRAQSTLTGECSATSCRPNASSVLEP